MQIGLKRKREIEDEVDLYNTRPPLRVRQITQPPARMVVVVQVVVIVVVVFVAVVVVVVFVVVVVVEALRYKSL